MEKIIIKLRDHIRREKLPLMGNRILCAVSGGVDSVVLVHLLRELGVEIEIAHANFQLRGDESMRDELLVKELAKQFNIAFHSRHFNTESYAMHHKVSIQVAARELRYSWFNEIMDHNSEIKFIATAHHADDNIETLLINFFKGTGIQGLKGIPVVHDKILRPLLFATKDEISSYAIQNGIDFVDDSSNFSDKYTRNFFRLKVIPLIKERYPEVASNLRENIFRFREAELLFRETLNRKIKKLLVYEDGGSVKIPIEKLRLVDSMNTIIYEIFSRWGFHSAQVSEIIKLMDSQTGRGMKSQSHQILKNRNWFIITPINSTSSNVITLESVSSEVHFELGSLSCERINVLEELDLGKNKIIVNEAELIFPLIIRKWRSGDYLYPLGMKKKKKISRFLIDQKLSLNEKEKIWVMESNKKIIWIIGLRMDERFKVHPATSQLLQFSLKVNG